MGYKSVQKNYGKSTFSALGRSTTCRKSMFFALGHKCRYKKYHKTTGKSTFSVLAPRLPHVDPRWPHLAPRWFHVGPKMESSCAKMAFAFFAFAHQNVRRTSHGSASDLERV